MPNVIRVGPFEEFKIRHEFCLHPNALFHLRSGEALSPATGRRFREIDARAGPYDQRFEASVQLAQYLAGTFVLVLNWWIESKRQIQPSAVNDLFRSLVIPTLASNSSR